MCECLYLSLSLFHAFFRCIEATQTTRASATKNNNNKIHIKKEEKVSQLVSTLLLLLLHLPLHIVSFCFLKGVIQRQRFEQLFFAIYILFKAQSLVVIWSSLSSSVVPVVVVIVIVLVVFLIFGDLRPFSDRQAKKSTPPSI